MVYSLFEWFANQVSCTGVGVFPPPQTSKRYCSHGAPFSRVSPCLARQVCRLGPLSRTALHRHARPVPPAARPSGRTDPPGRPGAFENVVLAEHTAIWALGGREVAEEGGSQLAPCLAKQTACAGGDSQWQR